MGTLIRNLLLLAGSLVVAALLGEALVRLTQPQTLGVANAYHPVLGWRNVPNVAIHRAKREYRVTARINSKALRDTEYSYARQPGKARVLVVGDSFTYGSGVENHETYSNVLETLFAGRVEVINAGVSGYGTDQEYLFFETEGYKYQPDVVLLGFYQNDIENNLMDSNRGGMEKKPRFAYDNGNTRLTNVPVPYYLPTGYASRLDDFLRERSHLYTFLRAYRPYLYNIYNPGKARRFADLKRVRQKLGFVDNWETETFLYLKKWPKVAVEGWELTKILLMKLNRAVQKRGATLVILLIPDKLEIYDDNWRRRIDKRGLDDAAVDRIKPQRLFRAFSAENDIGVIFLVDAFRRTTGERLYFERDPHWTVAGHRRVAQMVHAYLIDQGLVTHQER